MSSYLDIAEQVLRLRRVPLGPHAILKDAFLLDLMPPHLHGDTQHKTLQARLSEDILYLKDRSRFVRTEPGKFFLREFLTDESIPAEFRKTITARRRKRELTSEPVLCISRSSLPRLVNGVHSGSSTIFEELRESGDLNYFEFQVVPEDHIALWCFVVFSRDGEVLTYRVGRYRSEDHQGNSHRTLGFTTLVTENQQTLFNHETLGIVESGVAALAIDLDFPKDISALQADLLPEIEIVPVLSDGGPDVALVVFETSCPAWFEPTARRLSINDMKWMQFKVPPNHLDDFDTWSQAVVRQRFTSDK